MTENVRLSNDDENKVERVLQEPTHDACYWFVYSLQSLDHSRPNVVVHVKPACHGKAGGEHVNSRRELKGICAGCGFWAAAFSADGDTEDPALVNPIYQSFHDGRAKEMSFKEICGNMIGGSYPEPFVTNFLHRLECLRIRADDHELAMGVASMQTVNAEEIGISLGIQKSKTKKSCGFQLKNKLSLDTFSLTNVMALAEYGRYRVNWYEWRGAFVWGCPIGGESKTIHDARFVAVSVRASCPQLLLRRIE